MYSFLRAESNSKRALNDILSHSEDHVAYPSGGQLGSRVHFVEFKELTLSYAFSYARTYLVE